MAHPLRRRLMDVLKVDGPSTATSLAHRTEQAVANISHHLRVLEAAELVEQAPELARDKRERWWRLVSASLRWSTAEFGDDPAASAVAEAAQSLNLDHHVGLVRRWFAASEAEHEKWSNSSFTSDRWLRLTPAELGVLAEEVNSVFERWARRSTPDDDQPRDPVFVFAVGIPAQP